MAFIKYCECARKLEKTVIKHFKENVEEYAEERESIPFPIDFDGRVLEVGCGARPSYSIEDIDFYGVDITEDMIRAFREEYPSSNLIVCDVMFLPFMPSSFQLIISNALLHHLIGDTPSACINNIEKAIREIKMTMSSDSILIIKELLASNYIYALVMYYVTLACAKLNIEIEKLDIHSNVVTYFLTKKKLISILHENGFKIEKTIMDEWRHQKFNLGKWKYQRFNLGNKAEVHARK